MRRVTHERYISQSQRANCDLARRYVGLNLSQHLAIVPTSNLASLTLRVLVAQRPCITTGTLSIRMRTEVSSLQTMYSAALSTRRRGKCLMMQSWTGTLTALSVLLSNRLEMYRNGRSMIVLLEHAAACPNCSSNNLRKQRHAGKQGGTPPYRVSFLFT